MPPRSTKTSKITVEKTNLEMVSKELEVMKTVANAIGELDEAQQSRVLQWVSDRFDIYIPNP